jgi:conjugal transfer pilin signal peptidase TrbI
MLASLIQLLLGRWQNKSLTCLENRVALQGDHICVNDYDCGKAFNITSSGLLITLLKEGCIPDGYLFVHASHPDSFDSRYEQFGLINIDQLKKTLWPIF